MGYFLKAIVGKGLELQNWAQNHSRANSIPLPHGFAISPITESQLKLLASIHMPGRKIAIDDDISVLKIIGLEIKP